MRQSAKSFLLCSKSAGKVKIRLRSLESHSHHLAGGFIFSSWIFNLFFVFIFFTYLAGGFIFSSWIFNLFFVFIFFTYAYAITGIDYGFYTDFLGDILFNVIATASRRVASFEDFIAATNNLTSIYSLII